MRRGGIGAALVVLALSTVAGCSLPHRLVERAWASSCPPRARATSTPSPTISASRWRGSRATRASPRGPPSAPTSRPRRRCASTSAWPCRRPAASPAQTPANLGVYQQLAQSLVDAGQAYAILRVGWEWSTTYFSWGVQNTTPAQYVTAFDDIVTTMRSVPGQHFLFDWCAAADETPTNGSYAASYPGDQYVDYIGTDQYDNPGSSWTATLDTVGGLSYTRRLRQGPRQVRERPRVGPQRQPTTPPSSTTCTGSSPIRPTTWATARTSPTTGRSTPTSPSSPTPTAAFTQDFG